MPFEASISVATMFASPFNAVPSTSTCVPLSVGPQYIRGDAASETMDIYTRVDREDARKEYLGCIKPPNI
jgi:hypothetical protein